MVCVFAYKEFGMKKYLWPRLGGLLAVCLLAACPAGDSEEERKPEIPVLTGVSVETSGIKVSWNPVNGTNVYIVYRRDGSTGNGAPIDEGIGSTNSNYTDTAGTAGQAYSYAVAARNNTGTSEKSVWSEEKVFPADPTVKPGKPAGVEAAAQSSSAITITWTGISNATGYNVYRADSSGGNFTVISGTAPWTGTSYTDSSLTANKEYFYQVTALNAIGESEKSDTASAKTGTAGGADSLVDYTSYESNYAFLLKNYSAEKLVAFKGNLQISNIVGGIPDNASSHAIKNDTDKFTKSEGFPLVLLTEEQYNANKNNLGNPGIIPYARIFVFYNKNGSNEKIYEINSHTSGNRTIVLHNNTGMNVELRRNGIYGIPIGFAPQGMVNNTFYVDDGDYQLFPVFIKYNSLRDEVVTVYPKFSDGNACTDMVSVDERYPSQEFDLSSLLTQDYTFSTGTAHLVIDNQSGAGSINLREGNTVMYTTTGISGIVRSANRTFPVLMIKIGENKYETKQSISTYSVGQFTGTRYPLGEHLLEVDKVYKVTVTGQNISSLQVSEPVEIGSVSLEDF